MLSAQIHIHCTVRNIFKCRNESDNAMRIFKKPIINFSADDYYYLIGDNSI